MSNPPAAAKVAFELGCLAGDVRNLRRILEAIPVDRGNRAAFADRLDGMEADIQRALAAVEAL